MLLSAVHKENGEEVLHLMMVDDGIPDGAKLRGASASPIPILRPQVPCNRQNRLEVVPPCPVKRKHSGSVC